MLAVDLCTLLSNLSPQVLDLWKQPIPTSPSIPSQPARKLQLQRRLVAAAARLLRKGLVELIGDVDYMNPPIGPWSSKQDDAQITECK